MESPHYLLGLSRGTSHIPTVTGWAQLSLYQHLAGTGFHWACLALRYSQKLRWPPEQGSWFSLWYHWTVTARSPKSSKSQTRFDLGYVRSIWSISWAAPPWCASLSYYWGKARSKQWNYYLFCFRFSLSRSCRRGIWLLLVWWCSCCPQASLLFVEYAFPKLHCWDPTADPLASHSALSSHIASTAPTCQVSCSECSTYSAQSWSFGQWAIAKRNPPTSPTCSSHALGQSRFDPRYHAISHQWSWSSLASYSTCPSFFISVQE